MNLRRLLPNPNLRFWLRPIGLATKGTALKAKEEALADQQRAHNICTAELGKEVEALKASKSLVEKAVARGTRRVDQLEKVL